MEDSKKGGVLRVLQVLIPIVGVSIAVVSLLLTVAARRKELTCTQASSTRLVSENLGGIHPDLHVEFGGQPVVTLSKLTFSLRNTGAAAIKGTDVIEPVRLQFPSSTRILSAVVERTSPQRFGFTATAVPGSNEVVVTFSLLNAGDEGQFAIYVLNSEVQRPLFLGRVVDVTQMLYVDATSNNAASPGVLQRVRSRSTRSILRWSLSMLFWALAAFLFGVWVAGIVSYLSFLPWKRKFKPLYDEVFEKAATKRREELKSKAAALGNTEVDELKKQEHEILRLDREAGQLEMVRFHFGSVEVDAELKKKGIPDHPHPMVETLSGLMGLSVLLLSVAFVSAIAGLIINEALRS